MKLSASQLSVGATKAPLLQDVNLEIQPGRALVILGPNGSGKSTLLRTLARQLKSLAGSVRLDDSDIWQLSPAEFARTVAFVPQSVDTDIHLSLQDYVSLGRSPHQSWWQWQQTESDKSAIENAIEATELAALRQRSLSQLSGGERQRAAVAIALAQQPKFLLLDEPTAHLDFKHQSELLKLLIRLKPNLGLVVVLHDLAWAAYLADEVMLLKTTKSGSSSVMALGATEKILLPEILQEVFEVDFASFDEAGKRRYFVNFD